MKKIILMLSIMTCFSTVSYAESPELSSDQKSLIDKRIEEWVMAHPDMIKDSLQKMESREKTMSTEKTLSTQSDNTIQVNKPTNNMVDNNVVGKNVDNNMDNNIINTSAVSEDQRVVDNYGDWIFGNSTADDNHVVTVFIDRSSPDASEALLQMASASKEFPKILFIIKELPLIDTSSILSSKIAIVLRHTNLTQAKTFEAYLTQKSRPLKESDIWKSVQEAGANPEDVKKKLENPIILEYLKSVRQSSTELGIKGTPVFLIGKHAFVGLQDDKVIKSALLEM